MATSIAWASKVITVNQADLTLVSGTFYTMDTNQFRKDLNALQASEAGIWADTTHLHNTEVSVGGTTYARTIEIINNYSVQFLPNSPWSVQLLGSNNNIWDIGAGILVQNQVQVIPTNAAGLITTTTGSGLDAGQDAKLTNINALLSVIEGTLDHRDVMRLLFAVLAGKVSGAGTGEEHFRDLADSKDRVITTVDANGNRTAISRDST